MKTLKTDTRHLLSWMRKKSDDLNRMVSFDRYESDAVLMKLDEDKVGSFDAGGRRVIVIVSEMNSGFVDCRPSRRRLALGTTT